MTRIARKPVRVSLFIVLIIIVGCTISAPPPTTPTPLPTTQAVVAATELPTQTETAVSTPTKKPTNTPQPPTNTPSPTSTTTPSPTPTTNPTETSTATALPAATEIIEETAVSTTPALDTTSDDATTITLADLPAHSGAEVTVSGQVVAAASFSQGFKLTLDDGTGRAELLLWHNVYDEAWDAPQLNIGATVQATGTAGQYDGTWQVEPDFGGDVDVITPGGSFAPARPIGELASHVGELAQISGTILRLEGAGSGVKIFVGDDTGEVVVFVWRTVLDRIPNNVALGEEGTRVKINGRVENYRSNLELVPSLPYDVEVLP
jgi:DNA/RNA endonuclease YhcR with UshA esterase domain